MTANKHDTYTVKSKLVGTTLFLFNLQLVSQVGRSVVDRASSSDARGPGFEPLRSTPLKKIPLLYPEAERFPEEPGAPLDL